jgi:heat shock protein HslJ
MDRSLLSLFIALFFFGGCATGNGVKHQPCREMLYGIKWNVRMIDNDLIGLKQKSYLRFSDDGKIGGFSGCNSFFGKVKIDETTMRFGIIGSTRKFCMGEAGRLERRIFSILKGTKWWQFDETGDLVIFDDEHRLILSKRQ